ncbi:sulfate transporter family protein [Ancylobacter sp. 6x-1]|uniref:Sulfate transporter family protein n=1 Tax=Ancylobacter crimeensis TaxID=2579147 RepID=A0ABT0DAS5_9HYPH|nr:sulfate transporter family protein [Ancylobacter crimeensis]MCK0197052.1 sulfate transporter family protein [Ancylobacter crimeensis]
MLQIALLSFAETFAPQHRSVLLRSVGLAIGLLVVLGIAAQATLARMVDLDWHWAEILIDLAAALGIIVAAVFLVPPVTSLIAGLFLDDVAETVERTDFPDEPVGRAVPVGRSIVMTIRFFGVMVLVNLIALLLLLVPGVNLIVFYVANGYLLGREYFQLAALRYRSEQEAAELRSCYGLRIFIAGLMIAVVVSIPIVNLVTPIFATIFMVRLHHRIGREAGRLTPAPGSFPASGTNRQ